MKAWPIEQFDYLFYTKDIWGIGAILLASWLVHFLVKAIFVNGVIKKLVEKTKTKWDDLLFETQTLHAFTWLIPFLTLNALAPQFGDYQQLVSRLAHALIFVLILLILTRALEGTRLIYNNTQFAKKFPIHPSYITLVRILFTVIAIFSSVTIMMGKSPWAFITGLGAFSAVLLLVFRDTLLSFTSSVVINTQNLIKEGDWIEVPQFNADGDVIHMGLHIIKVQNWDRTIVTIPTHKLMETTLKNWRGMVESKGRRIMRNLYIDLHSIRHLTSEDITRLKKCRFLKEYLEQKEKELQITDHHLGENEIPINQRRLTNIGTFRKYIENYLLSQESISQNHTFMIRQLQSNEKGLPLQIYCFANTTEWVQYENTQSEIFDHLLAIVSEFDLKLFQYPSELTLQS